MNESGMVQTGIEGIQLFKITDPIECSPAVYEPSVTAIVLGTKEAILDGIIPNEFDAAFELMQREGEALGLTIKKI